MNHEHHIEYKIYTWWPDFWTPLTQFATLALLEEMDCKDVCDGYYADVGFLQHLSYGYYADSGPMLHKAPAPTNEIQWKSMNNAA